MIKKPARYPVPIVNLEGGDCQSHHTHSQRQDILNSAINHRHCSRVEDVGAGRNATSGLDDIVKEIASALLLDSAVERRLGCQNLTVGNAWSVREV